MDFDAPRCGVALVIVFTASAACGPDRERGSAAGTRTHLAPILTTRPQTDFNGRIRVATVFPTVGRYAISGTESQQGARLAIEELNAAGGIHGRPLQLLEYGTGSYFIDARAGAESAADEGGAVAIVGSNSSSLSKAVAAVAERWDVPQVSNVSTAYDLTWDPVSGADRPFVFRMCASDRLMGRRLARFVREQLGVRRVAVVYEVARAYSNGLAASFMEAFRSDGGHDSVAEYRYLPLETDFRPQLRQAAAFRPGAILVPGSFTDATLVATQAEGLGLRSTLLGGDGWSSPLLFSTGGPSRVAYFADLCTVSDPFRQRYGARFGGQRASCRALLSYQAVQAIAAALRTLGPLSDADLTRSLPQTRVRVRAALAQVRLRSEGEQIRFDAHGDAARGIAIYRVSPDAAGYRVALERAAEAG